MYRIVLPILLLMLTAVFGCGSGDSQITSDNLVENIFENGEGARMELASGSFVDIPQGTFADRQLLSVSDLLSGSDNIEGNFPTATKQFSDRIAAVILNTPVDALFQRDITVRFALNISQTPGTELAVYIHDSDLGSRTETFDNGYVTWYRYGSYAATVDSSGNFATVTLNTTGNRGFFGTLGLFREHTVASLGAADVTEIRGRVLDNSSAGVSTDVELNFLVGEVKIPVRILNGSIPAGGTVASIVTSDASGNFTMQVPDIYISQIFNVSFGIHDPNRLDQDEFVVELPHPIRDDEVNNIVVRYGVNNIVSEPVGTT